MDCFRLVRLGVLACLISAAAAAAAEPAREKAAPPGGPAPLFPFVLPWDDDAPGATNVSAWIDAPAGRHGPVVVKDGHLYAGRKRLRIFGVNLCFGANFPTHEEARRVAARMAKFGINCVRFHHMDMMSAPDGIFAADGRTLDPGQLDRLDFLISELKARGIYADLNLHVSRSYPGRPTWPGMPEFFKGVDNVDPAMIEQQRTYARDLLTHVNAYTHARYADEPAVALIEINNENALIHQWWGGGLDEMPAPYADELARRWNAWLSARYADAAALRLAWGPAEAALGPELLGDGTFSRGAEGWYLERHEGAEAELRAESDPASRPALRVEVKTPGRQGWHVQLSRSRLALRKDQPYTVRFLARADAPTDLQVAVSQAHEPWQVLWSSEVPLTTRWKEYRLTFSPGEAEESARLVLGNLGLRKGTTWLADVSLRIGGAIGLRADEEGGHVRPFRKRDFASRSTTAQRDWIRFLLSLEEEYWTGMARYVKEELKARAPVVGTQMGWSPYPIQARLDVIDSHAYWQHPEFHGKSWDPVQWTIVNEPMAGAADGGRLPSLGLSRVAGKPFICTEYNHSAPNTYGAEAFPLICAYAALQDWDGVFAFAYSHRRGEWDARRIPGFFDIDQHPTKMASLPAAVALFVRGDLRPPLTVATASPTLAALVERVRRAGPTLLADAFGVDRARALRGPVAVVAPGSSGQPGSSPVSSRTEFVWNPPNRPGVVTIDAPRSKAVVGKFPEGAVYALGDVMVTAGPTRQGWATLLLTAIDGPDFRSPGRLLITAAGDAENTAMGWKDARKSSVGADWGKAPSLVEGIAARITLPVPSNRLRAWALDERGGRRQAIELKGREGRSTLAIGPEHRTLWYEVEIAAPRPEPSP